MRNTLVASALAALISAAAQAESPLFDPAITHAPQDGVIRVFGPGGPHTAYIRAAEAFEAESGVKVEVT